MRRAERSGFTVLRQILYQDFSSRLSAPAPEQHSIRDIRAFKVTNAATRSVHDAATLDDEIGTSVPWTIIQRPIQEMLLKSYAQHATVAQPLILHGPRGVGKRTIVEKLVGKWKKGPHICASIDLSPKQGSIPPWTRIERFGGYREGIGSALLDGSTDGQDFVTLPMIRSRLEQSLESLLRKAVEMGCVNSENVLDALLERHGINGALCQYLRANGQATTQSDAMTTKSIKEKWKQSIEVLKGMDEVCFGSNLNTGHYSNNFSLKQSQSWSQNWKQFSTSKAQTTEETLLSLALAKNILKIQEDWRLFAGSKSQGIITRTLPDAATNWAVLLLRLLSFGAQEGHFQSSRNW